MLLKTICLLVISNIALGEVIEPPVDFSQHQIVRVLPNRIRQLNVLEKIKEDFNVDFWNPPMKDLRPVLTLIGPENIGFLSALNSSNIKYEIAANSFQRVIDAEREEIESKKQFFGTKAYDYDNTYHNYDEIVAELQSIPATSGGRATYKSIGTTYQNRAIPSITITSSGGGAKQAVILECGIHAREWVSTASCMWIANALLNDASNAALLAKYKFIIIPTLNSDGYVYTWTTNRQWRKTRTPYSTCYGADPNRNWDAAHCKTGASTNPCSDTYCGPSPFSEKCAKAMSDVVNGEKGNIAAYFSIHSYSQIWMWPWGYTTTLPPNNAELNRISTLAVAAIKGSGNLDFTKGSIANAIYVASGSSIDWAYDVVGVKIAFALELRDKGQYGFVLPPAQIKAACTETWAGIKAAVNAI